MRVRAPHWEMKGLERATGQPLTVACVGHLPVLHAITHRFFKQPPEMTMRGRVWLNDPRSRPGNRFGSPDVICIAGDSAQWHRLDTGAGFYLPLWSRGYLSLETARHRMHKSNSIRDDLRKVLRNSLTWSLSDDVAELEHFYHAMHLPYVSARHGDLAMVDSWEDIKRTVESGEFILARDNTGKAIGGITLGRTQKRIWARALGLIDDSPELLKSGVMSMIYRACLERTEALGYTRLGMGSISPFLDDGVTQFKRKWGLTFLDTGSPPVERIFGFRLYNPMRTGMWLRFPERTEAAVAVLNNNPFVHQNPNGQLVGHLFTQENGDNRFLARYTFEGLAELKTINPGSDYRAGERRIFGT